MNPLIKRVLVGFVGGLVTLIGVVALVAPGPGWLIIFTGLGILASEFAWAARVLTSARGVAKPCWFGYLVRIHSLITPSNHLLC